MAGTGPKIAETPLELLSGYREPPYLHNIWGYLVGGLIGFGGSLYATYATKKPLMSGIHRHAAITVGFALIGNWFHGQREAYSAERDAVLRHYVELHPDDFPPYQRKKFSEVLNPWVPVR